LRFPPSRRVRQLAYAEYRALPGRSIQVTNGMSIGRQGARLATAWCGRWKTHPGRPSVGHRDGEVALLEADRRAVARAQAASCDCITLAGPRGRGGAADSAHLADPRLARGRGLSITKWRWPGNMNGMMAADLQNLFLPVHAEGPPDQRHTGQAD